MSTATNLEDVLRYPRSFSLEGDLLSDCLEVGVQKQLNELLGVKKRYKNGEYIFAEGETFGSFVEVNSGALKLSLIHI